VLETCAHGGMETKTVPRFNAAFRNPAMLGLTGPVVEKTCILFGVCVYCLAPPMTH
jgi:hypothetical protein